MPNTTISSSSQTPLVSVGIPTFNHPDGLRRTLRCIVEQSYGNLEIIVSDNCSPGSETEAVVREFCLKDNRIQYFRQDTNKGPAFNFRFVLEKATGEYFMFAADDDAWDPLFIGSLIGPLEKYPDASVAMCGVKRVDESGNFLDITRFSALSDPDYSRFKMALYGSGHDVITFYWYGLFRLKDFKKFYKNFDNSFAGDLVLICEMLMSTRFCYVDKILHTRKFNIAHGTAERYPDEEIGKNYGDRLKFFGLLFRFGPYLFRSENIPARRKIWIPFMAIALGLWMCRLFYLIHVKKIRVI